MEFYVEQAVPDTGVKLVFAAVCGLDNHGEDPKWAADHHALILLYGS